MTLLQAARIVHKLGIAHDIQFLVGRFHVQEPTTTVGDSLGHRAAMGFESRPLGPDAQRYGKDACVEACRAYAVAVHRHNLRTYGRVVGGRI